MKLDLAALAPRLAHGVRARYVAGCRCEPCRLANREYARARLRAQREGDWNGLMDAMPVRTHIKRLRRAGLGTRAIAAASDVRRETIRLIGAGRKLRVRARAARRILAVTKEMISDRALVPAHRLRLRIDGLLEEGFTKTFIARQLGYKTATLQFGSALVTARNRENVERLWRRLTA